MVGKLLLLVAAGLMVGAVWPRREMPKAYAVNFGETITGFDVMEDNNNSDYGSLPDVRGFRNNNPGNIEYHLANQWHGQTGSDGRYAVFSDMGFGIRAIGKVLNSYYYRHGLVTIRQIITRWAPHVENLTEAYINSVSQYVGVGADEVLNLGAEKSKLVAAIIRHENGSQPFSFDYITRSLAL